MILQERRPLLGPIARIENTVGSDISRFRARPR
jgi:hypothetical protein